MEEIELAGINTRANYDIPEFQLDDTEELKTFNKMRIESREISMRRMEIFMRAGSALLLLLVAFWVRSGKESSGLYVEGFCMKDLGHIITAPINDLCHESRNWLTFFEVTSSGTMDLVMIHLMVYCYFKSKNLHAIWTVVFFYGIRAIVQGNFKMRYPDKGIWDEPPIPSLVVPYGLQSDYYFSGHCGFLAINATYMWNEGRKKTALAIIAVMPYIAFTLIMSRIHYTIDIPIGAMFGCWLYIIVGDHVDFLNF